MGNFWDKSTETTLHEICVQVFLRFSDSSKPSQSVSLMYELAGLAGIGKSEENVPKTSCRIAPVTKVAHIFWWHHDNGKQSASARKCWCDVSCDIPYYSDKCTTIKCTKITPKWKFPCLQYTTCHLPTSSEVWPSMMCAMKSFPAIRATSKGDWLL